MARPKGWAPTDAMREKAGLEAQARAAMKRDLRIAKEQYEQACLAAVRRYMKALEEA